MSATSQRTVLALLAALIGLVLFARLRYPERAPVILPGTSCDAALWGHVYRPERLKVIEACTAVEGRVVSIEREGDGDLHVALDPEVKSVLNVFNVVHTQGHLVVERICDHAPTREAAIPACAGLKPPEITIPKAGDRIRVTGVYVTDQDGHWNEIHPVTRIEVLR